MKELNCVKAIVKATLVTLVAISAVSFSVSANAATLQEQFRDDNNDLICVYDSHGKNVYVNKGFSGHCSFNVPDSKLQNN